MEVINKLEQEWKQEVSRTIPKNDVQWLEVFPEAKTILIRKLTRDAACLKKEIAWLDRIEKDMLYRIKRDVHYENQWFWNEIVRMQITKPKEKLIQHYRRLLMFLSMIKNPTKQENFISMQEQILRAKAVPIDRFFPGEFIKKGNKMWELCPFHAEKTPSFVYFPEVNKFHCFSCGENGDVIDFVQKLFGLSFNEALKKLL